MNRNRLDPYPFIDNKIQCEFKDDINFTWKMLYNYICEDNMDLVMATLEIFEKCNIKEISFNEWPDEISTSTFKFDTYVYWQI